jgi:hypothetical protein
MLYVAFLLSQSHHAGANRATRPDDVFERPPVPVIDGAKYVVCLNKSNHLKT